MCVTTMRFMRPIRVGEASDDDRRTVERLIAIQDAALARGFGMSETLLITESGYERLTQFPRQLFVS